MVEGVGGGASWQTQILKVKGQFIKGQMAIKKHEDEYKGFLSDAEYK